VFDDVAPATEAAYCKWQRELAHRVAAMPWFSNCLRLRGVDALPGGKAKGEFYPRFFTLLVLDGDQVPDDGELAKVVGTPSGSIAQRLFARAFVEINVGRRRGRFLSEPQPRSLFIIGQKVYLGREADYNHWFDVDDGSREPPISHYDERLSYPGFVRGTRMSLRKRGQNDARAAQLAPNYLTIYEVESPDALQTAAYTHAPQNRKSAGGGGMFRLLIRHTYLEIAD
jgi:hypothetical protein